LLPLMIAVSLLAMSGTVASQGLNEAQIRTIQQLIREAPNRPSPGEGELLYRSKGSNGLSCESCHTPDPKKQGEHVSTKKLIRPLHPEVQSTRFADSAKVEKWFRRNCNDVLARECHPQEKANFLAWLMQIASVNARQ
jgi:hypothetical protein